MKKSILNYALSLLICGVFARVPAYGTDLTGFVPLFDGKTLNGWHKFAEMEGEGTGKWEVVDGAIVGGQYPEGKGGLLVTDKQYSDYELYAEVYTTWPLDTGLFLRILPEGQFFQVTIDFRPTGEVGALHGPFPGSGGGFFQHCFEGFSWWNPYEYNPILVRMEGQPPRIQVWIHDHLVTDYQDTLVDGKPRFTEKGHIGIQVHPGESWGKGSKVAFRKIMIKELE
ncbi:MAG TPA: DUF1080 domain-containing protein [archaeon]|nr:DUF1080 domain-containing protein [archaeon]